MQTTVRITPAAHKFLKELASREHVSMQQLLERALEQYRRLEFLHDVNAAYAELRADASAWRQVEAERAVWDATLADGLPEDEAAPERALVARPRRRPTRKRGK